MTLPCNGSSFAVRTPDEDDADENENAGEVVMDEMEEVRISSIGFTVGSPGSNLVDVDDSERRYREILREEEPELRDKMRPAFVVGLLAIAVFPLGTASQRNENRIHRLGPTLTGR